MPLFTIEMTYQIPCYRHTTYEAETLEEAIEQARQDDEWDHSKMSYDGCGLEYVTGAWAGEQDYVGDCLFSEQNPDVASLLVALKLAEEEIHHPGSARASGKDIAEIVRAAIIGAGG